MRSTYSWVDVLSFGFWLAAIAGLLVSVILVALGQYWVAAFGGISSVSFGGACGLYILAYENFKTDTGKGQSIVLAILFANVCLQTYEVVYHFAFPVYFNYFKPPYFVTDDVRYLAFEGTMLLPIVLVRRRLKFGPWSKILLTFFALIWAVWILSGFPQYFVTGYFYPTVLPAPDPYRLSLVLNFGSKAILILFFASLLVEGNPGVLQSWSRRILRKTGWKESSA